MLPIPLIRRFKEDCKGPYGEELGSPSDVAYFRLDHQVAAGSTLKLTCPRGPKLRCKGYQLTSNAGIPLFALRRHASEDVLQCPFKMKPCPGGEFT